MSDDYDDGPSQAPVIPTARLKLDEIKGETQIRWLWPDKVPVGHVTIVAGEASSGKSLLAAEIAARVSSGAGWPRNGTESVPNRDNASIKPGTEKPGSVLIAHANQHENLVLKGRLLAAGADPSRVSATPPPRRRRCSRQRGLRAPWCPSRLSALPSLTRTSSRPYTMPLPQSAGG
jgi:ABC-type thiamine transport system ATPase subunit